MFKEEIWANLKFFLFNSRRKQESLFFVILNFIHQFQMQFSELVVDCLILFCTMDIYIQRITFKLLMLASYREHVQIIYVMFTFDGCGGFLYLWII